MNAFEQLGVQPWLAKQCGYMALHQPTPIQSQCIPAVLSGKNVVGGAATGSGKTAAFALPILQILSEDVYGVFALVLTPSRELAYQITDQFIALGAPLRIRTMLGIGGVRHEEQVSALASRPHVVVATPGRLRFLLETFSTEVGKAFSHLRFLVLDEGDRLTEGDIFRDVRAVLHALPPHPRRRALIFTATLCPRLTTIPTTSSSSSSSSDARAPEAKEINLMNLNDSEAAAHVLQMVGVTDRSTLAVFAADGAELMHGLDQAPAPFSRSRPSPHGGNAKEAQPTAEDNLANHPPSPSSASSLSMPEGTNGAAQFTLPDTLHQYYIFIPNMVKLPNLVAALRARGKDQSTIVFTNSCLRAELVRLTLQLLGFPVCSLNSLLTQQHRLDNLAMFKLGLAKVMVCTDIASRGLDIPAVGMVIHYDVPKHASTYVHRVGRTARAGREGDSVTFVTEFDVSLVQRIEKRIGSRLTLWKEKALRESNVVKLLDEVSAAKVQAKQQVTTQFENRVGTLKQQAAEKRAERQEVHAQRVHLEHAARQQRLATAAAASSSSSSSPKPQTEKVSAEAVTGTTGKKGAAKCGSAALNHSAEGPASSSSSSPRRSATTERPTAAKMVPKEKEGTQKKRHLGNGKSVEAGKPAVGASSSPSRRVGTKRSRSSLEG